MKYLNALHGDSFWVLYDLHYYCCKGFEESCLLLRGILLITIADVEDFMELKGKTIFSAEFVDLFFK